MLELCHLLLQQKPSLLNLRDAFGQTAAQVAASRGFMPPELRLLLGRMGHGRWGTSALQRFLGMSIVWHGGPLVL